MNAYLHALIHAIHSYISCIHTFSYYHALLHSYIHSYMTCVHTFIAFIHAMHSYLNAMHSFLHAFIHTCIHAFITFILSMHMHSYMSCVHTFHAFILTCIHACHTLIHVHIMSSYMSCMNGQRRENTFADVASHGHHSKISGLPDSLWHLKRFRFHFELDWMIVRVTRVLHPLIYVLEMHMHPPKSREMSTSKWLWIFLQNTVLSTGTCISWNRWCSSTSLQVCYSPQTICGRVWLPLKSSCRRNQTQVDSYVFAFADGLHQNII